MGQLGEGMQAITRRRIRD